MYALLDLVHALRDARARSDEEWWYVTCSNASPPTFDDARKSEQYEPELFFQPLTPTFSSNFDRCPHWHSPFETERLLLRLLGGRLLPS
jgi:hypothetical protein